MIRGFLGLFAPSFFRYASSTKRKEAGGEAEKKTKTKNCFKFQKKEKLFDFW